MAASDDIPLATSIVELQDPKEIKVSFVLSGLQVPKKGLFAKKPPTWWPSHDSNADVSRVNIAEANSNGDFGVATLYMPIDAKGGPKALQGVTPAEYTKHAFRLRLSEEDFGRIRRQLEKGVGQDSGVGAGVSSEWAPPPESRIEYGTNMLNICLRPKRN